MDRGAKNLWDASWAPTLCLDVETRLQPMRKFFSFRHALRNMRYLSPRHGNGILGEVMGNLAMSLFSRYCALRSTHPMSKEGVVPRYLIRLQRS
jgi:hypothetical protein